MSPDAIFEVPTCSKIYFLAGALPKTQVHSASPRPLSCIERETSEKKRRRKKEGEATGGKGRRGESMKGGEKEKKGVQNFKLCLIYYATKMLTSVNYVNVH